MFCNSDNSVYLVYDDDVCGIEISSLPIDVWHLSMLYSYVDILTGDRMIVGISNSVRLATGFGGFMPSHSLAPVMIPQTWVATICLFFSSGVVGGQSHIWKWPGREDLGTGLAW